MKIRPIKVSQMDTNYLINLLEQRTTNYNEIMSELEKRLKRFSLKQLLTKWCRVENPILKDLFEVIISQKIRDFEILVDHQDYPKALKKYVEEVKSFDAIWTLMTVRNEDISTIAKMKCYAFIDAYMDEADDKLLYKLEGDDTYLFQLISNNVIVEIPKVRKKNRNNNQGELGKVYQFKKMGGDKK